ncbi:hypothetical protein HFO91_30555 [Rhizobium leguminosarum]|uniref:hypothetical protein n=1 Tax=Rhizobium leguminosarum TaxID=384 RepID=UPI001C94B15F|nr:hypothetical protein [Rhizobium leguminosarum]MBY5453922.1 hypothetical protein [Rhizobium leguminosarum]
MKVVLFLTLAGIVITPAGSIAQNAACPGQAQPVPKVVSQTAGVPGISGGVVIRTVGPAPSGRDVSFESWVSTNAIQVYPTDVMDCRLDVMKVAIENEKLLTQSLLERQEHNEIVATEIDNDQKVATSARIEALEKQLADLQKTVQQLSAKSP